MKNYNAEKLVEMSKLSNEGRILMRLSTYIREREYLF